MQQYRADIDGLRAIAVLSVAIFHAEIGFFTGGYIGVDIFFVISGYLITNIIVREIGEGRFSYFKFYERRLRRIAPALIVVLAVVTALTMLLKTPKEARFFGESVTYAVLMISNFFFYQETNYFSAPLDTFALLHTWSLSVEEQFYLLWPPILALLFGYAARWTRVAIIALTALSFLSAAVVVSIDKNAAFFLLPFRMWELSLGALIALGVAPRLSTPWMAEAAAALGLVLILSAAVLFDGLSGRGHAGADLRRCASHPRRSIEPDPHRRAAVPAADRVCRTGLVFLLSLALAGAVLCAVCRDPPARSA